MSNKLLIVSLKINKLLYLIFLVFFNYQLVIGQPDSLIVPVKDSLRNKYGFVNKEDSSKYIINPHFDNATIFHNEYARASIGEFTGLINKKGDFVFKKRAIALSIVSNDILIAKDSVFTILNIFGEPIVNFDFSSFYWSDQILYKLPIGWEEKIISDLNDSIISHGELITRVLSMYQRPEIKFNEMINIAMAYDEFCILVLEQLNEVLQKIYGEEKLIYIKSIEFRQQQKKKHK